MTSTSVRNLVSKIRNCVLDYCVLSEEREVIQPELLSVCYRTKPLEHVHNEVSFCLSSNIIFQFLF